MESTSHQKLASNSEPVHLAFECSRPEGDAEGKAPVIFLHGITASRRCWGDIPQIVANGTKREVYAVDLRHHGDSPWSETFDFGSNGLDLRHFMDTHRIDQAVLVGHSMGGVVAMNYAMEMPQKIEKLVIEEAPIGEIPVAVVLFLQHKLSLMKASIAEISTELDEAAAHKLLPKKMLEKVPEDFKEFVRFDERTFALRKQDGKFTFKANIDAIFSAMENLPNSVPKPKGRYDGPTCFIYGKKSPINVGSNKYVIKRYFPNAELIGVENAGHTVHNESRLEFQEILLNFLQKECVARL